MKCSLDKVLGEARQLANRMRSRDESVEGLLKQASTVQSRLEAMRQYQEEVLSLSELSRQSPSRPRGHLVLCMAAENKQLEQLRQENEALRTALDEHQAALELIMTKYRNQMMRMMRAERLEEKLGMGNNQQSGTPSLEGSVNGSMEDSIMVSRLMDRMAEMASVVRTANNEGDLMSAEMEAMIQQLLTENEGLRQMLQISRTYRVGPPPKVPAPPPPPPQPLTTSGLLDIPNHLNEGANEVEDEEEEEEEESSVIEVKPAPDLSSHAEPQPQQQLQGSDEPPADNDVDV